MTIVYIMPPIWLVGFGFGKLLFSAAYNGDRHGLGVYTFDAIYAPRAKCGARPPAFEGCGVAHFSLHLFHMLYVILILSLLIFRFKYSVSDLFSNIFALDMMNMGYCRIDYFMRLCMMAGFISCVNYIAGYTAIIFFLYICAVIHLIIALGHCRHFAFKKMPSCQRMIIGLSFWAVPWRRQADASISMLSPRWCRFSIIL